jgi:hypothetical protein
MDGLRFGVENAKSYECIGNMQPKTVAAALGRRGGGAKLMYGSTGRSGNA